MLCIDAVAVICIAAIGVNSTAGDTYVAIICIDAVAISTRRVAGHIERAGAGNSQTALGVNAIAVIPRAAFDYVFTVQDDGRTIGQFHCSGGGGFKVHAIEGEGAAVPCAVGCACFRGVEQPQCCGGVGRKVCRCRLCRQCYGGHHPHHHHKDEQEAA